MTALKPVRAEQVRRPERKQNWTVPHCGYVLPICLSLRPVGSIHISCLAAREQTSAAQIAKASPPYNMKYFYSSQLASSCLVPFRLIASCDGNSLISRVIRNCYFISRRNKLTVSYLGWLSTEYGSRLCR